MKILGAVFDIAVAAILLFAFSSARAADGCESKSGLKSFADGSLKDDCKVGATGNPEFDAVVKGDRDKGVKIVKTFDKPTETTCNSFTYRFPEVNLEPGESLYVAVPKEYQNRPMTLAILEHRQDPDLPSNKGFQVGVHSTPPGRTSYQILTKNEKNENEWRYYQNPNGGGKGSKFAEPNMRAEVETLYGVYKYGHCQAETDECSTKLLNIGSALRMNSIEKDPARGGNPVLVRAVKMEVAAPKATEQIVGTFSKGTDLGEPVTEKGQKFGGGQTHGGLFPGALVLGYGNSGEAYGTNGKAKLPAGWKVVDNRLIIPVPPGKMISNIEVAAGDSHPDGISNEDGGTGTKGWAKMNIFLDRANGIRDVMANRSNVPPQGVMMGAPKDCSYVSAQGDQIVIESLNDTSYVMAVRLLLRDAPKK